MRTEIKSGDDKDIGETTEMKEKYHAGNLEWIKADEGLVFFPTESKRGLKKKRTAHCRSTGDLPLSSSLTPAAVIKVSLYSGQKLQATM